MPSEVPLYNKRVIVDEFSSAWPCAAIIGGTKTGKKRGKQREKKSARASTVAVAAASFYLTSIARFSLLPSRHPPDTVGEGKRKQELGTARESHPDTLLGCRMEIAFGYCRKTAPDDVRALFVRLPAGVSALKARKDRDATTTTMPQRGLSRGGQTR